MRTALKGVGRCLHAWGLYVREGEDEAAAC